MRTPADSIKTFENSVAAYISRHSLLRKDAPVICALSGGADSVALIASLSALGYNCIAAHCNYHLRGAESIRDMHHAAAVAASLKVDFCVRDFDVHKQKELSGESVEAVCRRLRYSWFADLADKYSAQAIAVGHHSEDRAETFLLNLMRGAGITGLTSMRPRHEDVVRPLLGTSRALIEEYLAARGLSWVNDSSNASDAHRRNRVRNQILPLMEQCFPGALQSILKSVSNLEAAQSLYNEQIKTYLNQFTTADSVDLSELSRHPQATTILWEFLAPKGFSFTQVTDILATPKVSGASFISADGTWIAERGRGTLKLSAGGDYSRHRESYPVNLRRDVNHPLAIEVSQHNVTEFRPRATADEAFFDADFVFGDSGDWQLRHWQRGDRIRLFGSGASKLVSDLFTNAKFTAQQKRECWVMTCNDEIVWIPGLRNSNLGTIGPDCKTFVHLKLKNHKA